MTAEFYLPCRSRRLMMIVLTVAFHAVWSVAFLPARAEGRSLVVSGPEQPWGWTVEYDVDIPVDGQYTPYICYASAEARPVEVFFDAQNLSKCCTSVTFGAPSTGRSDKPTGRSSAAKWESVATGRYPLSVTKGIHTIKIRRRGPLPNLVALRLDTTKAFPETWQPPKYEVRDLDSIPAEYRKAFDPPSNVDVPLLRESSRQGPGQLQGQSLRPVRLPRRTAADTRFESESTR